MATAKIPGFQNPEFQCTKLLVNIAFNGSQQLYTGIVNFPRFKWLIKNSTEPLLKKIGGGESCGPQLSTAPFFLSNGSVDFF